MLALHIQNEHPRPASYLRSSVVKSLHQHHKGVGSIPVRRPMINKFFLNCLFTVSFLIYVWFLLEIKTHLPFTIYVYSLLRNSWYNIEILTTQKSCIWRTIKILTLLKIGYFCVYWYNFVVNAKFCNQFVCILFVCSLYAYSWDIMLNTRNKSGISVHHVLFCMYNVHE